MDGHVMRCDTIGSCQSAATTNIVIAAGHESDSCKRRYSKCLDLYLYYVAPYVMFRYFIETDHHTFAIFNIFAKFRRGHPLRGCEYKCGYKFRDFQ